MPIAAVTALYSLTARAAEVVAPISAEHGASAQQVALAWQLQGSPQSTPIPGTTSLDHLMSNVEAESLVLDADEMAALNAMAD